MPPPHAQPPGCFTPADLRAHGPGEAFRPLLLVADHHASVASALSRSLADSATVLSPVTSLELMRRIVPVVSPLVLVSELDYGGVLALDVLHELARVHPAVRIIACAGHDNDVMRRLVGEAGLFDFVAKRDPLDKLRDAIASASTELQSGSMVPCGIRSVAEEGGPTRQKPHTMGVLVRWGLDSGFKRAAIRRVLRVSSQTVAYHAWRGGATRCW